MATKIDPEVLVWNEATGTSGLESPTTNYHYNAHNDVVAVTNARGYTNTQRVENGVVLQEFDAAGGVKDKGYNIFGDVIAETRTYQAGAGANRLWTRYQYDAKGQLTQIQHPREDFHPRAWDGGQREGPGTFPSCHHLRDH